MAGGGGVERVEDCAGWFGGDAFAFGVGGCHDGCFIVWVFVGRAREVWL